MDGRSERFIERMGQLYQHDAMPRIAGRMFGLLLLTPEPLSMDEVAELLQVSKASVSANARLLETTHMIGRVTKPGDRRDYYEVTEDTHQRLVEQRIQRLIRMKELFEEGLSTPAAESPPVRERLRSFRGSFDTLIESMGRLRASWASSADGAGSQEEI